MADIYSPLAAALMQSQEKDYSSPYRKFADQLLEPSQMMQYYGMGTGEALGTSIAKGLSGGLLAGYSQSQEEERKAAKAQQIGQALQQIKAGAKPSEVFSSMPDMQNAAIMSVIGEAQQEYEAQQAQTERKAKLEDLTYEYGLRDKNAAAQQGREFGYSTALEKYKTALASGAPLAPEKLAKMEDDIRQEVNGLKPVQEYDAAVAQFRALEAAIQSDNPADEPQIVTAVAKIYDPTGTVREGEFAVNEARAQSLFNQYKNYITGSLTGRSRMPPEVRQALYDAAKVRMGELKAARDAKISQYRTISEYRGLNPAISIPETLPMTRQPQQPAQLQGLPDFSKMSDEQLRAIANGG